MLVRCAFSIQACAALPRIGEARPFARDSFKFQKRSQFVIGGRNETLSVAVMRISNPDYRISVALGTGRDSL
ncbi:MAG: hypothetical protein DME65_12575 [Verrucomicrobia bacterium]|nr:MAG: hypothetical protein DME65_12575 [Verrucomicrobiota bacterium]